MRSSDDEFLETLRETFKVEAAEHVQAIASGLVDLEKSPDRPARERLVDQIFRAAHSLKGAARAVDFLDVESLCQSLEDTFATWRDLESALAREELDRAHGAINAIGDALTRPPAGDASPLTATLVATQSSVRTADSRIAAPEETVRLAVSKLDAQLVDAEEMLAAKLMAGRRAQELRELLERFATWRKEWGSIESHARAVRRAITPTSQRDPQLAAEVGRVVDFLDWNADYLKTSEQRMALLCRAADHDTATVGKLVDDLLENSKKLLLLPFGTLASQFPRIVRDLCRDQGKDADLVISGEDIEIDKRILEEMKDPLVHLLRNCVDHGIETGDARVRAGKPVRATIVLAAARVNGNKVQLVVSDDGAGIDLAKVRESAVRHGVVSHAQGLELDDSASAQLIFESEVSTSTRITRLSGRGLGLAIVREKADRLGGSVMVESQTAKGTQFTMILPAQLATFRGLFLECAQQLFVVPTAQVERVARVARDEIGTVEDRFTVTIDAKAVAFIRLSDVLQLASGDAHFATDRWSTIVVLGSGEQRIAVGVDAVIDEQEVLVKPLRKPLSRVRHIAGATILPSGQVVPILNVADLLKSARTAAVSTPSRTLAAQPVVKSILVAEDSITSRMLMKNILESAGFKVATAVDGMDAFTLLRAGRFDLVVSDVEMPRLNGFDLTARIRADKRLRELPVILVTALERIEDRTRGIDVGADAYIVKSTFDQHDLLDAVRRLV